MVESKHFLREKLNNGNIKNRIVVMSEIVVRIIKNFNEQI